MGKKNTSVSFLEKVPAFKRMQTLQKQKRAHNKIISRKEKLIAKTDEKITNHFPKLCQDITDEILSRDLGLSEQEFNFLQIPTRSGKSRNKIKLLQELIRRELHSNYFIYVNDHVIVSLTQIHKAIGEETDRKIFLRNLNKKLEGIIRLRIQYFVSDTKDYRRAISGKLIF